MSKTPFPASGPSCSTVRVRPAAAARPSSTSRPGSIRTSRARSSSGCTRGTAPSGRTPRTRSSSARRGRAACCSSCRAGSGTRSTRRRPRTRCSARSTRSTSASRRSTGARAHRVHLGCVDGRRGRDDDRLSPPRPLRERHELLRRLEVRPRDVRASDPARRRGRRTESTRSTWSTTRATCPCG